MADLGSESVRVYETVEPHIQGMLSERALVINLETGGVRHAGYRIGRNYGALGDHELPVTLDFSDLGALVELKTGHMEVALPADNLQIQAQAYALATVEQVRNVTARLVRVPDGKAPFISEPQEFGPLDLGEILFRLRDVRRRAVWAAQKLSRGERPPLNEGAWCKYCPARLECPAKTSLIRAAAGGDIVGQISRENAADVWLKIERIEEVVKAAKAQLYAMASSQEIPLGGGYVLGETLTQGRESLDAGVVWAVLRSFGEEYAKQAVRFSATKSAIGAVAASLFAEHKGDAVLGWKSKASAEKWLIAQIRERGGMARPPAKLEVKKYKRGEVAEEVES